SSAPSVGAVYLSLCWMRKAASALATRGGIRYEVVPSRRRKLKDADSTGLRASDQIAAIIEPAGSEASSQLQHGTCLPITNIAQGIEMYLPSHGTIKALDE